MGVHGLGETNHLDFSAATKLRAAQGSAPAAPESLGDSASVLKSVDWELQSRFEHIPDQDLQGKDYLSREKQFTEM